jgi:hypothetical protein
VTWKVGGLPNSAVLYHLEPIEMDANAASALFVRCSYPETLAALLASEDAVLARSNTPPGDLRDLPAKTVAFMFVLREIAEDPAVVERADLLRPIAAHLPSLGRPVGCPRHSRDAHRGRRRRARAPLIPSELQWRGPDAVRQIGRLVGTPYVAWRPPVAAPGIPRKRASIRASI